MQKKQGSRTKRFFKNLLALGIGFIAALLLAEIVLRIYNPFAVRIKGDRIILPVNQKYVWPNKHIPQLDDTIYHSKNSLGFRGPEKPDNFDSALTIITIGGSTTECAYLSDGHDWPAILGKNLSGNFPGIWVNNAGLDGHSTYGHTLLLEDYIIKLKPDYAIFLTGANDIKRKDLSDFDSLNLKNRRISWKGWLVYRSEVLSLVQNFWLAFKDPDVHIGETRHPGVQITDTLHFTRAAEDSIKRSHKTYVDAYGARLRQLVKTARANTIEPVFCTQPTLWGYAKDPVTGIDLSNRNRKGQPSGMYWEALELYNDELRTVCREMNVLCVDLAAQMPKSSLYFYDEVHFSNQGAEMVAEIVSKVLGEYLQVKKDTGQLP